MSMCRTYTFSSDMTIISYFSITINVIIITNSTFSRVRKIFVIFFSHHKFFVIIFIHHITTVFIFINYNINKTVNSIHCTKKKKFSIKDFFSKCNQIRKKLRILVTFTEEIFNGKLHFLCRYIHLSMK